jgi:hypothetical protein
VKTLPERPLRMVAPARPPTTAAARITACLMRWDWGRRFADSRRDQPRYEWLARRMQAGPVLVELRGALGLSPIYQIANDPVGDANHLVGSLNGAWKRCHQRSRQSKRPLGLVSSAPTAPIIRC